MSTMAEIADLNVKCGGAGADTGTLGCQTEFGTPLHGIGMRKGTVIPKDTVFDKAYIDAQTQKGVFIPVMGAESFEEGSSEDSMSTNSRGVERLSTPGLPKYNLTYEEGHEYYKELSKLTSFKSLDYMWGDGAGNWKMAVNSDGDFTGYTTGQTLAMMTKTKVQGGDPESKTLSVQMLDREQWDRNYAIFNRAALTFSPEEIDGVNGVMISLGAIADGESALNATLVLKADRSTPVEGWGTSDFLVEVNGVADDSATVAEGVAGNYAITLSTPASSNDIYTVSSFDASVNAYVVIVEGSLFRSGIATVTAT